MLSWAPCKRLIGEPAASPSSELVFSGTDRRPRIVAVDVEVNAAKLSCSPQSSQPLSLRLAPPAAISVRRFCAIGLQRCGTDEHRRLADVGAGVARLEAELGERPHLVTVTQRLRRDRVVEAAGVWTPAEPGRIEQEDVADARTVGHVAVEQDANFVGQRGPDVLRGEPAGRLVLLEADAVGEQLGGVDRT